MIFGLNLSLNLSWLLLFFLLLALGLGNSNALTPFWEWTGICAGCCVRIQSPRGIFCANFSSPRGSWPPCRKAWHGKCYKTPENFSIFVQKPEDDLGNAWVKTSDQDRFLCGRNGDNLLFPFQCDLCWFRNLKGRDPDYTSISDSTLLKYIRRVNLDGMWSREPSTIRSNLKAVEDTIKMLKELDLDPSFPPLGPWPLDDAIGFKLVIAQIRYSQLPGKNQRSHLQFDTIRKLRTSFSHLSEISVQQLTNPVLSFRAQDGKLFTNSNSITQGRFYEKCMAGMLSRMGRQTVQNVALSYKILHLILLSYEIRIKELESLGFSLMDVNARVSSHYKEFRHVVMHGCIFLFGFVLALRGNEIFLMEAGSLIRGDKRGLDDKELGCHVVFPLLGRFKGEEGERYHLLFSVSSTGSGFKVRTWMERLVGVLRLENSPDSPPGPAFTNDRGVSLSLYEVDDEFHKQLSFVQSSRPDLIEPSLKVSDHYSIYRSLRRGSTSRAIELKLSDSTINLHNRWRSRERSGGQVVRGQMKDLYTEMRLTGRAKLEYTKQL